MTLVLLETGIPADELAQLAREFCQGGEMVHVGDDQWEPDVCRNEPVPGGDLCRRCGGQPGLETFEGNPLEPGAPQAWWLS
jgi:hypothetical protein